MADLSVEAFLGYEKKSKPAQANNLPTFTEDDAEYALKIAARMGSDFAGEAAVAKAKLEKLAADHGMTAEELVEKANEMCPGEGFTAYEQETKKAQEELRKTKETLNALQAEFARRDRILSEVREQFAKTTKDQLIELIAEWKATGKLKE
jgi:flagellar motility protein MotE (MotC chaperone)